jgi:hypothetical protein
MAALVYNLAAPRTSRELRRAPAHVLAAGACCLIRFAARFVAVDNSGDSLALGRPTRWLPSLEPLTSSPPRLKAAQGIFGVWRGGLASPRRKGVVFAGGPPILALSRGLRRSCDRDEYASSTVWTAVRLYPTDPDHATSLSLSRPARATAGRGTHKYTKRARRMPYLGDVVTRQRHFESPKAHDRGCNGPRK